MNRFLSEGPDGLSERSSRPHRLHCPTPPTIVETIIGLRRQRLPGNEIAHRCKVSPATVSRILRAARLSRARDLDLPEPPRRYEHPNPGDMIHIDIKKLGRFGRPGHRITRSRKSKSLHRGVCWEYVHVALDDTSRIAFNQIHPDEKATSAVEHLKASVAYYTHLGITVRRVMTDNGGCYRSDAFRNTCRELGLRHVRTKPYTPRTNEKAERFIQTALREWAYAKPYNTSDHRAACLDDWTRRYNFHRPHGGINNQPPISRLGLFADNLLRVHNEACQCLQSGSSSYPGFHRIRIS